MSAAPADVLKRLDEARVGRAHWKILFISGMGFFTDAYDLFIIGVVMALIKPEWHTSAWESGLVTSTALLAAAIGALAFGRIADILGRKRIYGYEVLVLAVGAVASAFSPNIWWLIFFRFILGVGIGGDYPVSSTIMSEYASKATRGMMVTLVFTMQAAGLIFGPLLAAGLLSTGLSHDWVWRILLAFGAVPAMSVFQMRRHLAETPRFLLAHGHHEELERAAQSVLSPPERARAESTARNSKDPSRRRAAEAALQSSAAAQRQGAAAAQKPSSSTRNATTSTAKNGGAPAAKNKDRFRDGFIKLMGRRDLLVRLIGVSIAWFMMDFAYYGNTVSTPLVLAAITPKESLLQHTLTQLLIFVLAALPGYLVAALTMDRLGRKPIQVIGFLMMGVCFAIMALVPGIEKLVVPFLIIYGISYFFTEFGPNSTTFVYPAEVFPVETRTTGHGFAAATGKIGGFVGVFCFPLLLQWRGLVGAEAAAALASVVGLAVTLWLLPETKGKSLEELSETAITA